MLCIYEYVLWTPGWFEQGRWWHPEVSEGCWRRADMIPFNIYVRMEMLAMTIDCYSIVKQIPILSDHTYHARSQHFMTVPSRSMEMWKWGIYVCNLLEWQEDKLRCSTLIAALFEVLMNCCREDERRRIEKTNPNPRMPLVRFNGGTWRVGGLLVWLQKAFSSRRWKCTKYIT